MGLGDLLLTSRVMTSRAVARGYHYLIKCGSFRTFNTSFAGLLPFVALAHQVTVSSSSQGPSGSPYSDDSCDVPDTAYRPMNPQQVFVLTKDEDPDDVGLGSVGVEQIETQIGIYSLPAG